jgi:hypothetical protein
MNVFGTSDTQVLTFQESIDTTFQLCQLGLSSGGTMILMKKIGGKILKEDREVWHSLSEFIIMA